MKYSELTLAIETFRKGGNVTEVLRKDIGKQTNTEEIIEIAYDLQAGEYVKYTLNNEERWNVYTKELSSIISPHLVEGDMVLDAGTGEMTTLVGIANQLNKEMLNWYACDISWSRINQGNIFVEKYLNKTIAEKINSFVASIFHLPMSNNSMDVVFTVHAIEPNGGKEQDILRELFRVAKRKVILFEPSYEKNTDEGKVRMQKLGYIKGLPTAIQGEGGIIDETIRIENVANPLNPTYAYVITPPQDNISVSGIWSCPTSGRPMERLSDCFWSPFSGLAYPIINGVPVFRRDAAVLATGLGELKA